MPDQPHDPHYSSMTIGEVGRRVDASNQQRAQEYAQLTALIESLRASIQQERSHVAATYVRVDNNDRDLREIRDDVTELKENWKDQKGRNRQILLAFIVAAITILASFLSQALSFSSGPGG